MKEIETIVQTLRDELKRNHGSWSTCESIREQLTRIAVELAKNPVHDQYQS